MNDDNNDDDTVESEDGSVDIEDISLHQPVLSVVFTNFEQALKLVGAFGRYQWSYIAVLQVAIVLLAGNYAFMSFATYEPTVRCFLDNGTVLELNRTHQKERFCEAYNAGLCEQNLTWEAPLYTIIEEWSLICDLDHVPEMMNSVQMSGTFVAMAASGMLSDSFGRKRVFLCCFVLFVVATLLGTLASTWQLLFVSRFVVGGLLMATTNLKFVWAMEMTDGKHNVIMNLANMWHFGYMAAAVIGYLTKHWKLYLIALCCVGFPLMFVYTIFFESPRWLIQKGHLDKAAANLSRIGRRNRGAGAEVTSAHLRDIPREEQRRPTSYLTLFSTRKLTAYTLVMCSLVFATGASVNAYILQVSQLAGDPFIKFFLYGFLRLYIPPLLYMTNKWDWFGRRHMVLVPLFAVFLCFSFVMVVKTIDNQSPLEFYGLLAGAVICNCLWAGIGQFQIELFPTVVRSSAASLTSLSDPLASVLIPPLIYLQRYWPALPYLFATSAIVVALIAVYFVLPETKGLLVPDTIEDMDRLNMASSTVHSAASAAHWATVGPCCGEDQALLVENMESNVQESEEE